MKAIFLLLIFWCTFSIAGETSRSPANFGRIPEELNAKAIVDCLPKLKGFISSQETNNLNNLKTKVERTYGLMRPIINYREIVYRDQFDKKWKVEFYLVPDSKWGKEKYRLKFFSVSISGEFTMAPSPLKDDVMEKEAALRYAQYEEISSDERWEGFTIPRDPAVTFKSKAFEIFELKFESKKSKQVLLCSMAQGYPLCQCLK